jgi:hypothetical protein
MREAPAQFPNVLSSKCCRPLRGLASLLQFRTQGSRTRPGLHAVARFAGLASLLQFRTQGSRTRLGYMLSPASLGLRRCCVSYPGFADSPWATCCRPLRGPLRPIVAELTGSTTLVKIPNLLVREFPAIEMPFRAVDRR